MSTSDSKCAEAHEIMVQCPQRAEPSVQRHNCQTCLSRCVFGHLASEANPKNRRFFGSVPEELHKIMVQCVHILGREADTKE